MMLRTYSYFLVIKLLCLLAGGSILVVQLWTRSTSLQSYEGTDIILIDLNTYSNDDQGQLQTFATTRTQPVGVISWKDTPIVLIPPTREVKYVADQLAFLHRDALPVLAESEHSTIGPFDFALDHAPHGSILRATPTTRDDIYASLSRLERSQLLTKLRSRQMTMAVVGEGTHTLRSTTNKSIDGTTLLAILLLLLGI